MSTFDDGDMLRIAEELDAILKLVLLIDNLVVKKTILFNDNAEPIPNQIVELVCLNDYYFIKVTDLTVCVLKSTNKMF